MFDQDENILKELLPVFQDEALSKITQLNRNLMLLEQPGLPDSFRLNSTQEALRIAHTIKGNAASIGLVEIEKVIHDVESSMKKIQGENGFPEGGSFYSVWFDAVDLVMDMIQNGYNPETHAEPMRRLIAALAELSGEPSQEAAQPPKEEAQADVEPEKTPKGEPEKTAAQVEKAPEEVEKAKVVEDRIVRIPSKRIDKIAEGFGEVLSFRLRLEQRVLDIKARSQRLSAQELQYENMQKEIISVLDKTHRASKIEVETYEKLRNIIGDGEKLGQVRLRESRQLFSYAEKMHRDIRQSGISMKSQEDSLRRLQMTPVADMFESFRRFVRDASIKLNKKVNFTTEGESVELDRNIIQQLRDPLIHLLRNSLDHGLEESDKRVSKGKPPQGQLTLRAFASSGGIVVEIADDGEGLNTKAIMEKAINIGMISADEAESLNERTIQSFAFRPGFSTKNEASLMSGRGVGLDFVRDWVDKLGGRLEWESTTGLGTLMRLRLPLTMATIQALVARISNQKFAMPLISVDRVLKIEKKDVVSIESKPCILLDGQPVELILLEKVLGLPPTGLIEKGDFPIVISSGAESVKGWVVSELIGEQEIIMKNFSGYIEDIPNVAGAAIMGSGDVILVLNAADLHRSGLSIGMMADLTQTEGAEAKKAKRILVADDSLTTRTLEKLILTKAGYEVVEAKDGVEALETVQSQYFDLVLSDVQMPRMNGIELSKKIRQLEKIADIPIVIVSFMDKEPDKLKGLQAGANAYITKSNFSQARLLEIIDQLIGDR